MQKNVCPVLLLIGGPNGAGKTTLAYQIYKEIPGIREYVNADSIAAGLSPFNVEKNAIEAGRLMLNRIRKLLESGISFSFESTLSGRIWKKLIRDAKKKGYHVICCFISIESKDLAVRRVRERVKKGGHDIPVEVIRRRYDNGMMNFWNTYRMICDEWALFDNSSHNPSKLAIGIKNEIDILDKGSFALWQKQVLNQNR